MTTRLLAILLFSGFLAGCGGGVNILPEPFTRERADGKIPVKTELIRAQVRAELDGTPEGEAEVARWQAIETDYNACRLSSAETTKSKAEQVFANCMSERGYVYMFPIDAEQFHNDIAENEEKLYPEQKAEEARLAAEKKAAEEKERDRQERVTYELYRDSLIEAAKNGDVAGVRSWITRGADPNASDNSGETVLMIAVYWNLPEVINMLLLAGANPNAADGRGWTALMGSVVRRDAEVVRILLSAGANPNAMDWRGNTSLMEAAATGRADIVNMLLSAGANPNATDKFDKTASDYAKEAELPGIVRILEAAGAR